jgi:hypothetical protein
MGKKRKAAINLTDRKEAGGQDRVIVHLRGRDWEVNSAALDDAELMESLIALDEGNPKGIFAAIRALLGESQRKEVMEALRDQETGITKMSDYTTFFTDLMHALNPNF